MSKSVFLSLALPLPILFLSACGSGGGGNTSSIILPPGRTTPAPQPPQPPSRPPVAPSITDSGTLNRFDYGLWNTPEPGRNRALKASFSGNDYEDYFGGEFDLPYDNNVRAVYQNDNGFMGIYSYKGRTGEIVSDVKIDVDFNYSTISVEGWIGQRKPIYMNNQLFGELSFNEFSLDHGEFMQDTFFNFSECSLCSIDGKIEGKLSNDGSNTRAPSLVSGTVEIYGFSKDFRDNEPTRRDNALVGAFVAEKQ